MLALIDTLAARYSIDRERVYAAGCSNGAIRTWRTGEKAIRRTGFNSLIGS